MDQMNVPSKLKILKREIEIIENEIDKNLKTDKVKLLFLGDNSDA